MTDPLHVDGWENLVTGLGVRARDKRMAALPTRAPLLPRDTLEDPFHGEDIVARIVELPAQEMTREWIRPTVDARGMEPEQGAEVGKRLMQALDDLDIQAKVTEALVWSRLHGGAVLLLGVDDGRDPAEPLACVEWSLRSSARTSTIQRPSQEVRGRPLAMPFKHPISNRERNDHEGAIRALIELDLAGKLRPEDATLATNLQDDPFEFGEKLEKAWREHLARKGNGRRT